MEIGTTKGASLVQLYQVKASSLSDLDTNGDNALDLNEVAKALTGKNYAAKSADKANSATKNTFDAQDTNRDGKLSSDELGRDKGDTAQAMQLTMAQLAGNLLKNWWSKSSTSDSGDQAFGQLTGDGDKGATAVASSALSSTSRVNSVVESVLGRYRQWQSARAQPASNGAGTDLAA
ncbi:EF hand [Arboricoccus pini]|uniref:EF hand n=1 Tax=Arboricoccus pini TaxID=1963835 RepID=A0A212RDR3_9PROT|nr:EF-hand domain-containing protein [Arboricoccus pini]SNB70443.1 EF hand [Arboricoccus pini]